MNSINDFQTNVAALLAAEQQQEAGALEQPTGPSTLFQPADTGFLGAAGNGFQAEVQSWVAAVEAAIFDEVSGASPSAGNTTPQDLTIPGFPGSLAAPGTPNPQTTIPDPGNMPFNQQGNTNDCGPTSLSMILNYYGIPATRQGIDDAIHRGDNSVGGTPEDEMQYAEDQGLAAAEYNNGTWDEVKAAIDAHHPVMASITGSGEPELSGQPGNFTPDGDSLPNGRHQIVITGYETGPDGKQYVLFHDPNHGQLEKMSVDDFQKVWSKEDFGVKNFFMVFAPGGTDLPPSRMDGAQGAMTTLNGAANLINSVNRIFSPNSFGDWVHGFPEFVGGLFQVVGGGVGALLQLGAEKLRGLVDGVPVLRNFVDPFTDLVSGAGGCIADVFNGFGKGCNDVGSAFDDLCHGNVADAAGDVGQAAVDVGKGVVNAVGDAASAVGNAISSVFSGW
jgi:Peptidase_C39 like family